VLIIDKINIGRGYRATFRDQLSKSSNEALDIRFDVSGFLKAKEEPAINKNIGLDAEL
jgi:hypothetical protein